MEPKKGFGYFLPESVNDLYRVTVLILQLQTEFEYMFHNGRLCDIYRKSYKNREKMTRKVLILSSSPRRGGNSDRLCDRFMEGAREAGHEAEKILLEDKTLNYCTGCGICSMYGKPCPQQDDAAGIVQKMVDADVIVLATPVYFYTMCAQMKTLIDRCCSRYLEITDKEFYFIVSAAENSVPMMERTIEGFRGFLDCLEGAVERGVVYGVGAWKVGEIEGKPSMDEAFEMGRNI